MAGLTGVHIPISQAIGIMMMEQIDSQLMFNHGKISDDMIAEVRRLTRGLGIAIEAVCDSGDYDKLVKGRGMAVLITGDSIQVGAYDLASVVNDDLFNHDFNHTELWSGVLDLLTEKDHKRAALCALAAAGREAVESWSKILEVLGDEPSEVPFMVSFCCEKGEGDDKMVGGLTLLARFPMYLVRKLDQAATRANEMAEMQATLDERPTLLN